MTTAEIATKTPAEAREILVGMGIDSATDFYDGGFCDEYELNDGTIEIYCDEDGEYIVATEA